MPTARRKAPPLALGSPRAPPPPLPARPPARARRRPLPPPDLRAPLSQLRQEGCGLERPADIPAPLGPALPMLSREELQSGGAARGPGWVPGTCVPGTVNLARVGTLPLTRCQAGSCLRVVCPLEKAREAGGGQGSPCLGF